MLNKELTNDNVVKCCIDYLNSYAENDDVFRLKLETNSQTTADLEWYILEEARKYLVGRNGGIEKETVFGWAIHFVDENITKAKSTQSSTPTTSKEVVELNTEDTLDDMEDESYSEEIIRKTIKTAVIKSDLLKKKAKVDLYQGASLFDF